MKLIKTLKSKDNTTKLIFDIGIESVILYLKNKVTLCLSSQVGCKFNCSFCRTGKSGFKRNLTKNEIIEQYLNAKKIAEPTAIVFMGMGEPLDNYDNVVSAIKELNEKYHFSEKKITVSTCGIPENIIRLGKETKVKIAISLNATDNDTRNSLMPINKTYNIKALIDAIKKTPNDRHRPIMIEYVLIKDINDKNVEKIANLFKDINIMVSLIPFNCHNKSKYQATDLDKIKKIKEKLISKGIKTFIRENKGNDILAACGTLG